MIQEELKKILEKGVVVKCEHEAVESIHPFFFREKTDGTQKLIHNLKSSNGYLQSVT